MPLQLVDLPRLGGFDSSSISGDAQIFDVTHTTLNVPANSMFCCVRGASADGHDFAAEALRSGAVALLVDRVLPIDAPQLQVVDVRKCMALSAAVVHGYPSRALRMVGVTGTNGKTTTAHMIGAILSAAKIKTTVAGTLSSTRTTPESTDLQRQLESWKVEGGRAYVMEVSSHALDQDRVAGTEFDVAVFTNLSRDHLDYHGSEEAYFRAKAKLFSGMTDCAVINRDDVHGRLLLEVTDAKAVDFGRGDAVDVSVTPASASFRWEGVEIVLPMGGEFNVMNALAAATAAREMGISASVISAGLANMTPVRGRMEPVANDRGITVLVDYAHTPDALDKLLVSLRTAMGGKGALSVVFGCGGDRDPGKRAPMGRVAAQNADRVILTSDNSRSESSELIIAQIMDGVAEANSPAVISKFVDREAAIVAAIDSAIRGDVVVIAGKGHETTQDVNGVLSEFDDAAVARKILGGRA